MDQEQDWADGDPEIASLLTFEPVLRRTRRHDGWTPGRQRGFIAALARLGSVDLAAQGMGGTASGIWKVRESAGAQDFAKSWDGALALFHRRNPALTRRGGRARPPWCQPKAPPPAEPEEPTDAELHDYWQLFRDKFLKTYVTKLAKEREARLRGCIVEADFYVRQLCWFDVVIDLGKFAPKGIELLRELKRGGIQAGNIVATPMSLLLDHVRRSIWAAFGEPERPPPPELGLHNGADVSTGGPSDSLMSGRLSDAERALRAEANRLWEERARKDAAAWRARLGLPPLAEEAEGKGDA